MSCDWDVWCADCDVPVTGFCDANHAEEAMWNLVRHADAIAALAPLMAAPVYPEPFLQLGEIRSFGPIEPAEFAKHAGHTLKPKDEYGRWADQCHEYVPCSGECGVTLRCRLRLGHEGAHEAKGRP